MRFTHGIVWLLGVLISMLAMDIAHAAPAAIHDVRLWTAPDHSRVVFDLNKAVEYKVFTLHNPERIVVDVFHSEMRAKQFALPLPDQVIELVRYGRHKPATSRFVFVTKESLKPRSFSLKPMQGKPHRLVVDFLRKKSSAMSTGNTAVPVMRKEDHASKPIVIAIDAGHGGEDPGAIGKYGLMEKEVTLGVAKELARRINAKDGMRAVLTRTGDYFVSLKGRMKRARQEQADFMISIHADAVKQRYVEGASVYMLAERGATPDKVAAALAAKENAADDVGGVMPGTMDDPLVSMILGDMTKKDSFISAEILANQVLKDLASVGPIKYTKPKRARFVVLGALEVPSVLVELDYISNPDRERKLKSPAHREKIASALLDASVQYLRRQGRLEHREHQAAWDDGQYRVVSLLVDPMMPRP